MLQCLTSFTELTGCGATFAKLSRVAHGTLTTGLLAKNTWERGVAKVSPARRARLAIGILRASDLASRTEIALPRI